MSLYHCINQCFSYILNTCAFVIPPHLKLKSVEQQKSDNTDQCCGTAKIYLGHSALKKDNYGGT